jgi:hypothetical protein
MDPCQFGIGWIRTEGGQVQICRNRLPTHIVEEDSRDDHILIAFLRLQKFQGIVERNSSVDEILSGSKEGFGFFKNLLMDRFYQHWQMINSER